MSDEKNICVEGYTDFRVKPYVFIFISFVLLPHLSCFAVWVTKKQFFLHVPNQQTAITTNSSAIYEL